MRIVIDLQPCQNESRRRGIGRYSMAITKALIKLGSHHQFIIALNGSFPEAIDGVRKELADLLPQDAFVVFSVPGAATAADPANAWRNRTAEMARAHFLAGLAPDLVFIPSLNEGLWDDTVVSVEKDAPYLTALTLYDLIPLEDPARYLGGDNDRDAYIRRLDQMRRADLILPISDYVAQDAAIRLHLRPDRMVVAHCGVESLFVPAEQSPLPRTSLLADYGITRPYVMTASPLEARKNIEGLIAGFASMSAGTRDAHQLVLLGKMDAFARNYLGDLAKNESLPADTLVFPGFVPDGDLPALYHRSSVFAFPSFSEGFGLPLLEAMACGTPVVGSDRTSIPEVVGREDLLCDPSDAIAIGRAIERILSSPQLQRELQAYGPTRAARFTWEKAAAIILDSFEDLFEKKRRQPEAASAVQAPLPGLRTMAYVMPDVPAEHRLAGVAPALAASLADIFDVTVIDRRSDPQAEPLGLWIEANCAVQDADWFDSHADRFDHILYNADCMADAAFRNLVSRHPGSLVLSNRLSMPDAALTGRGLSDGAQLALLELEGPQGLSAAVAATMSADQVADLLHRDLSQRAGQVFLEAGTRFVSPERQIDVLPTALSPEARHAFRARANLADADAGDLIVAVAADEEAAEYVIRVFRQAVAGQERYRTLLVFHESPPTHTFSADGPGDVTHLFGGIVRMAGALDPVYRGLLSAADLLILDSDLPERTLAHFAVDAADAPLLSFSDKDFTAQLSALLASDGVMSVNRGGPASVSVSDFTGTAAAQPAALVLQSLMRKVAPAASDSALREFTGRIPAQVRGIKPSSDDLAQLAISLARNEAFGRPAQLYIDVTAFAGIRPTHRLDLGSRTWLEALFRQAGRHVRAVYADGDHFVVANQFTARICGIEAPGLDDHVMIAVPGDRILGLDFCHAFPDRSFKALLVGQRQGLSASYVVLGSLALEREELLPPLAELLLAWCRETSLQTQISISALPQASRAHSAAWMPHHHHERVAALAATGLYPHVLLCEDAIAESFGGGTVIAELSPEILKSYEAWQSQRRQPARLATSRANTAADFGHVVTGHLLGSYSLAIINRMMARTLEAAYPGQVRYLPFETTPIDHTESVPADEKPLMIELSARPPLKGRDEIVISHHYPILVPKGHYRLSLAMFFWEESHVPPQTIKQLAEGFDAIISPVRSVTNALIDSGLSIPVATIGQPVDVDRYAALAASRTERREQTTFLHVSSSFRRKGIDVLLAAWARAFGSADNVRLVIKTFPNPHNTVAEQVAALRAEHPDLARIDIISRDVEAEDMPQFYADADVMVLPTRGEGYNLPALEAMAAGLPLIVTGHGGHRDFCGPQEARLLRYDLAKSESHVGGAHSMWAEPDVDDLVDALREHVDPAQLPMIEARRQRAMLAAMRESNVSAWLHRYDTMIGALQKNSHQKPARIAWISTWAVQCGIAQYSSYLLNHFSNSARSNVRIVCDTRTQPDPRAEIAFMPIWEVLNVPKVEHMLEGIAQCDAEAVVIQHQDGLLSWEQLGQLAHDPRLAGKATIVILHNAGNMVRSPFDQRAMMLEGLRKLSRVLVHNIADVNFLASLGLKDNVGLLPHGAFARDKAPWPRRLSGADAPVIGCHGFFFRHKGIDKLIRAVALLRQEWPHLKLRLVNARFPDEGHDTYIHECKQLATSLGMADAIEWHQEFLPIEDVDALLAGCDVIALPYDESDDSASGAVRVSLTSMAPLVATKVKIFAELGDAAEWADSNDPQTLADVLALLLRSPERRRTVQAAMHEWLLAHDWTQVAGTLEGMINGLVKQKRLGWDNDERR